MIVRELSMNMTFDIGDGPMQPDPEIMRTGRVPVSAYTSDEQFERERALFGRIWLCVARAEEVAKPGDWIVRDIDVHSASLIIVRGKDMMIRAFHNICSHRGMKLAWEERGSGGRFSCPYHAWLYGSDGALLNIPAAECFPHVDKTENGLTPVSCDSCEGFVFVNLDPQPRQTLREFLGPVADRIAGMPFGRFSYGETVVAEVQTNWKFGIEAASEGYHVQVLHRTSLGSGLAAGDNPHLHFLGWEPMGPHRLASVPYNPDYKPPQERLVQQFSASGASLTARGGDAPVVGFGDHPGTNPTESPLWHHDQFMLFPNVVIMAARSGFWTTSYWPVTKSKSIRRATFYYSPPKSHRELVNIRQDAVRSREIFSEDSGALEHQQNVLESGAKPFVHLGENEVVLRHLLAVITAATGESSNRSSKLRIATAA